METRSTDAKGRISLPKAFANATVIIDQLSDTELRIRKAVNIPEDEIRFAEETAVPLSDRDRDRFLPQETVMIPGRDRQLSRQFSVAYLRNPWCICTSPVHKNKGFRVFGLF